MRSFFTCLEDKQHRHGPPYTRQRYETLDYITIPLRCQNNITDVDNSLDNRSFSDHPLIADVEQKLKAQYKKQKRNIEYEKCDEREKGI